MRIAYGDFTLRTKISVGSTTLASYTYSQDKNHYLTELDYGNGDDVKYTYDDLGRVITETYSESDGTVSRTVTYAYDNTGALATTVDSKTGRTTKYYYDIVGRISGQCESSAAGSHSLRYAYDSLGNLKTFKDTYNGTAYTTEYVYDGKNRVYSIATGDTAEYYAYDSFDRLDERLVYHNGSKVLYKNIAYEMPTERSTSNRVSVWTVTSTNGYSVNYNFLYDGNGNITSVKKDGKTTTYVYDSANQLVRENNQEAGKTWVWTYDESGNITSKKEYYYTTGTLGTVQSTITYGYDGTWGDKLISYNGKTITYDAIGNPLSDGTWAYTWEQGRQLVSMSYASNIWNFTYDANGMRTIEYFENGRKYDYSFRAEETA